MSKLKDYILQYGTRALDINPAQSLLLMALVHYRDINSYSNVCNPTHEKLAMATGQKKLDNVRLLSNVLEQKGLIKKTHYVDKNSKKKRCHYEINDDLILSLCIKVEEEWYKQFKKESTEEIHQAEVVANPEHFDEQEVKEAINPPPKPVPEGKEKNPITGRVVNKHEVKRSSHGLSVADTINSSGNLFAMLSPELSTEPSTPPSNDLQLGELHDLSQFEDDPDCPF